MENIMLHGEKKKWVKIVDFGLSNMHDNVNPLKTQCGSPEYAAPELFVIGKKYGPEVDLWSLGVILYVMGSGRLPFMSPRDSQISSDERRRRLMVQINRGISSIQEQVIASLTSEYKNLLKKLLSPDPQKRISIEELCCHPWLIKQKPTSTMSMIKMALEIAQEGIFDDVDHDMIMDKLMTIVDKSRVKVEMDVINKRFGKTGGMYNILAHKIQRNILKHVFKLQCCTAFRSIKLTKNKSCRNVSDCRNKAIQTSSKMNLRNYSLNKTKLSDSISIKNKQYSEEVFKPLHIGNKITIREPRKIMDCKKIPKLTKSNIQGTKGFDR